MKTKIKASESFVVESMEVLEIKESQGGVKKAVVKIISEGLTRDRQRFYTRDALKTGASMFDGAKMYLNHISESERNDRPERSVQDFVATVKNPEFVEVTSPARSYIKGEALIHGSPTYTVENIYSWLKNVKEAGASADLSIHAFLFGEQGEFDGRPVMIINGIEKVLSVDFVTTANAGGEIESVESFKTEGGDDMDLTKLTLDELKKARPDLVEALTKDATSKAAEAEALAKKIAAENESLKKEIADKKLAEKKEALMKEADAIIKEAKLPEATEKRVKEKAAALNITDKTESLKADVEQIIKQEKDYLESLSKTDIFANDEKDETETKESVNDILKNIVGKKTKK